MEENANVLTTQMVDAPPHDRHRTDPNSPSLKRGAVAKAAVFMRSPS